MFSAIHNTPLAFVDIETTGTNALSGRIIEIGILKVHQDKVTREFESLVNPEVRIDPFIEQMTGIKYETLSSAPLFSDIKETVFDILNDSIFVAHNVRFDYAFVRNEFRRSAIDFKTKHFDTVKLARVLYPGHQRYNLDAIMERFAIKNEARHRAMGDARVLWDFFKLSKENVKKETFEEALRIVLKKPSLPPSISQETVDKLPESVGVYVFTGEQGAILYIGKSLNVRDRVLSHFANDHAGVTDMKLAQSAKDVYAIETAGELSALLLESTLIKKHKPIYNRMLRVGGQMLALVKKVDPAGFDSIDIREVDNIEVSEIGLILGVFRGLREVKDYLYEICKVNKLCPKIMGLEKVRGACFNSQIGWCNGACVKREINLKYNLRFDEAFYPRRVKDWIFEGPIFIKEEGLHQEFHLVDKWCYLGSMKHESDNFSDLKKEYRFDYDTYKILRRFLSKTQNLKLVRNASSTILTQP